MISLNQLITHFVVVVLLLSDVNAQNKETLWTPLHAATFQEHGKVCAVHGNPE